MEKNYLVINIGSSSKRYTLFCGTRELASWYLERASTHNNYDMSIMQFFKHVQKKGVNIKPNAVTAIAFRVVAPGSYFTKHKKMTALYIKKLQAASILSPLHIEPLLHEIRWCKKIMPRVAYYAISDSAFHTTLIDNARLYGLPKDLVKKYDLYRFGYHGISCASVLTKLKKRYKRIPKNIVICHLSGGSSITAVSNGNSIDTSMGFTPIEGVSMATRCGTIDPLIVTYLIKQGISVEKLIDILCSKSGMVGLTGQTDMRKIVVRAQQKEDTLCMRALEFFAYQIKKYIGAYHALLGSIDLLVFTGGIGQDVALVRWLVCDNLALLGIQLDAHQNNACVGVDGYIQAPSSTTHVAVVKNEEMHELLHELLKLVS